MAYGQLLHSGNNNTPSAGRLPDPSALFDCGSDPVKLRRLFEAFERHAAERPQPDAKLVKVVGRCVPRADFVAFVRLATEHGGSRVVGAASELSKPILNYIAANCGRAGADWVTFDEFVLVLMRVIQG